MVFDCLSCRKHEKQANTYKPLRNRHKEVNMVEKTYSVRVGGWSNRRTVIERPDSIALEIAMSHNHCPTCSDRVRYVTQQLSQRNVQYSWSYPSRSQSFIVVQAPGPGIPATDYLSKLLSLHIG